METNCQLFCGCLVYMGINGASTVPASDNAAPLRSQSTSLRRVGGPRSDVAFPTGVSPPHAARGAIDWAHVG